MGLHMHTCDHHQLANWFWAEQPLQSHYLFYPLLVELLYILLLAAWKKYLFFQKLGQTDLEIHFQTVQEEEGKKKYVNNEKTERESCLLAVRMREGEQSP